MFASTWAHYQREIRPSSFLHLLLVILFMEHLMRNIYKQRLIEIHKETKRENICGKWKYEAFYLWYT